MLLRSDNNQLRPIEILILIYNLVNVLFTPSWIQFLTFAAIIPLAKPAMSEYSIAINMLENCGPKHLMAKQNQRAKDLYNGPEPVVSRTQLTQFMQHRKNYLPQFIDIDNKPIVDRTESIRNANFL
jgi:hypothetical protein